MLITERSGKLLKIDKEGNKTQIKGLPEIWVIGQGGLLDIKLHPDYKNNQQTKDIILVRVLPSITTAICIFR